VGDFVEARFDISFQNPVITMGRVEEDLLDGVLSPSPRTEAVATRLEIRLEDRLEDQLHAGLHTAVPSGRDAEPAKLPRLLRDELLPHRQRDEPPGLEIFS
jgi:hypothetical protein